MGGPWATYVDDPSATRMEYAWGTHDPALYPYGRPMGDPRIAHESIIPGRYTVLAHDLPMGHPGFTHKSPMGLPWIRAGPS